MHASASLVVQCIKCFGSQTISSLVYSPCDPCIPYFYNSFVLNNEFSAMLCNKSSPSNHLHRSHLLQVLDDGHVGVHVAVNAVLHARLLRSVESSGGDLASDALAEAAARC